MAARSRNGSLPSSRTAPSWPRRPMMTRVSVLLPEPFGPMSATRAPDGIDAVTPRSATTRSKRLPTEVRSTRIGGLHERVRVAQEQRRREQRQELPGGVGQGQRRRAAQELQLRGPADELAL